MNETDASPSPQRPKKSWLRRFIAVPTLVCIGLMVYLIFFGENSINQRLEYQKTIDSLSACLRLQQDSLAYYRELNRRITTDPELMEQVVREQYNMNRPHEDVFIIDEN